ncbi:hypothetical protein QTP86_018926, partial [Hemibagrus guttatus]
MQSKSLPTSNAFLPDELNHFCAHTTNVVFSTVVHPISLSKLEHNSNIIKYADDTTIVGRNSNNDELAYREEIQNLSAWSSMNNLTVHAMKTKELIVDFWKSNSSRHSPIYINGSKVECVSSFKFLGIHISEDLSCHLSTSKL